MPRFASSQTQLHHDQVARLNLTGQRRHGPFHVGTVAFDVEPAILTRDFKSRRTVSVYLFFAAVILNRRGHVDSSRTSFHNSNVIRLSNTCAFSVYSDRIPTRVADMLDHDSLAVQVHLHVVRRRQLTTHFDVVDQPKDRECCVFGWSPEKAIWSFANQPAGRERQ